VDKKARIAWIAALFLLGFVAFFISEYSAEPAVRTTANIAGIGCMASAVLVWRFAKG
jgi:hypothetical protein